MGTYEDIDVTFEGEDYPFNYNPVHALWQSLIMVGLPESWLSSASFLAAAQTIHTEGKGVSMLYGSHQPCLTYLKSILQHIDGILYYGVDGKFHVRLIRDDYTVSNLPVVDIDSLLSDPQIDRGSWLETYGEIKIQYNKLTQPEIREEIE